MLDNLLILMAENKTEDVQLLIEKLMDEKYILGVLDFLLYFNRTFDKTYTNI